MSSSNTDHAGRFRRLDRFWKSIKPDGWVLVTLVVVSILIAAPVYIHRIYSSSAIGDFSDHIHYAKLILSLHYQQVPVHILSHPAYQLLLIGVSYLTLQKVDLFAIAVLLQIAMQCLIAIIVYFWFGDNGKKNWSWRRALWALTLTLVTPIMGLVFWDKLFYFGYIGLATYHNPTVHLLKPVALLSFICAVRVFGSSRSSWKVVILSALLTVLSALIKPNYLICILPALGLVAVNYWLRKKSVDWRLLWGGFFLPGGLVLLIQFAATYSLPGNGNGSILFDPLGVISSLSGNLLPKLFLSVLFPLSVLVFNFRRISRDSTLLLAWLGFLISLAPTYFLAEGDRFGHGNFLWGSQVMLLILFVASARYVWREKIVTGLFSTREKIVELTIYAVHVIAGIAYYVSLMLLLGFS